MDEIALAKSSGKYANNCKAFRASVRHWLKDCFCQE